MEPLLQQLRELPARLKALPAGVRRLLVVAAVLLALGGVVALALAGTAENYQYAFTNLSTEDAAEAQAILKGAGVPFRPEAGGSALAVPASRVYDVRLLLAAQGLPRGGGVGFELFDRGDLGVTEFTQKVNLRRAIEGELARTIGKLAEVRSARIHVTLAEKGLYRDDDRPASAAVVVNLRPGRALGQKELAGIRHLVASAVPGLASDAVTIVDGSGTVLSAEADTGEGVASFQKNLERDLEGRIVALLERAVGAGAVVARVTAAVDSTEVTRSDERFDPDGSALRSERRLVQTQSQEASSGAPVVRGGPNPGGIAGAAANGAGETAPVPTGPGSRGASSTDDQTRNYELSKTVTRVVDRNPRLSRLSVAVIVDGVEGKPRAEAEVARLGELAKRAVGFDTDRGDAFEITSVVFTRAEEPAPVPVEERPWWLIWAALGAAIVVLGIVAVLLLGRKSKPTYTLTPGARVAELEAAFAGLPPPERTLPASEGQIRDRAREMAGSDPTRAAHLLKAWMAADPDPVAEPQKVSNG